MERDNSNVSNASWPEVITLLSNIIVFNQYDFDEFLHKFITILTKIHPVDSCLIYFYDKDKKQLALIASKKPHAPEIGKIIMEKGEGITGWVARHKQTVAIEKQAYLDPRFKPFKELPEDKYESFLSIPIVSESGIVGVVNLQDKNQHTFSKEEIVTVEALVKIISSAFAKVILERKVSHLQRQLDERKRVERAKGLIMKQKSLSEDEAYHFLRREAMKKRKSISEIADAVILIFQ